MNFCQQKNAFLAPKGAILGNRGHKTAPRAAEWAPTGKLKVSKVTSGYGEVMVPLNRVRLSARKGGYMGVALKHRKNCECCHHHSLFKGHIAIVHIVVLNCQKCNQCLKCQVSGHKLTSL